MLLTFLLAAHSSNIKTETRIVKDNVGQIRLRAATEGVANYLSLQSKLLAEGLKAQSGQVQELMLAGLAIRYRVIPESAYLSLNAASAELLQQLIADLDGEADAQSIAAAIVDWRDPDNIAQPDGAEAEDYEALGLGYAPRDGPFQSVQELARVRGMNRALLEAMDPFVTVFSNSPSVDLKYAPGKLVELLQGTDGDVEEGQTATVKSAAESVITFENYQGVIAIESEVYRVQVELAENHNQMSQQMEITVSFAPGISGQPFTIKKWNPYTAHFTLAEE